jgi:membrane protease subunit (stomatin/prohibitin family)
MTFRINHLKIVMLLITEVCSVVKTSKIPFLVTFPSLKMVCQKEKKQDLVFLFLKEKTDDRPIPYLNFKFVVL